LRTSPVNYHAHVTLYRYYSSMNSVLTDVHNNDFMTQNSTYNVAMRYIVE